MYTTLSILYNNMCAELTKNALLQTVFFFGNFDHWERQRKS